MEIRSQVSPRLTFVSLFLVEKKVQRLSLRQAGVGGSSPKRVYLGWIYDNKPAAAGKIQSGLIRKDKQFARERNKINDLIGTQTLSGSAVTERTDAVIKMSNVTGESAEEVSSYMTAIWNNFADGTESLEHYADVITKLGAATASSSEEIAEGLQKFASVGETVGLSYDYATTALATVVAETRQSADVVGTALAY